MCQKAGRIKRNHEWKWWLIFETEADPPQRKASLTWLEVAEKDLGHDNKGEKTDTLRTKITCINCEWELSTAKNGKRLLILRIDYWLLIKESWNSFNIVCVPNDANKVQF